MADKASNFKRLAVTRTNKALDSIRVLGNLGSPNYERTPEQVDAIMAALHGAVDEVEGKLRATKAERPTFEL